MARLRMPQTNSTRVEIKPRESLNDMKRLDGVFAHRQVESGAPMINNESFMRHGNSTEPFDLCSKVVLLVQNTKQKWHLITAKIVGRVSFIQNAFVLEFFKTFSLRVS